MTTPRSPQNADGSAVVNLGLRLREARLEKGISLRALARQLSVSPSFVSLIENGKSQPSVATLYSMAQVLSVSIDHLFATDLQTAEPGPLPVPEESPRPPASEAQPEGSATLVQPSTSGSPEQSWQEGDTSGRLSVTTPGNRARLVLDSGVVWEQLATNTSHQVDFIEITYPPGASSTSDERMLRHDGFEYGVLVEGVLEVTFGSEVFTLRAGDALGLDSSIPHLFRNAGTEPARGIWFVHHKHD